jgi:TATA-binding protein-associated factor Taf7
MNIRDCIPLAREDPATLVRTLEVIEMEDRASLKIFSHRLGRVGKKGGKKHHDDEDDDVDEDEEDEDQYGNGSDDDDDDDDDQEAKGRKASAHLSMRERCFNELETSIADHFAMMFRDRKEVQQLLHICVYDMLYIYIIHWNSI